MKNLFWIFPDRSSLKQQPLEYEHYWKEYIEAAKRVNFRVRVISAEAIDIVYLSDGTVQTFVDSQPVCPTDTIFVTELYTFPHQQRDILSQITTFKALQLQGFYLPIDPELSIVMNDKLATHLFFHRLREQGVSILPSIRLIAGRDLDYHNLEQLLAQFPFPLLVKPASWAGGIGVTLARNLVELRSILGLASGFDCAMIIQPWISSPELVDYRVFFVKGKPHTILARRARQGNIVANLNRGGKAELVEMPEGLLSPALLAGQLIHLPFFCLDFLFDGQSYWLSEVELDGGILDVDRERMQRLFMDRFNAYNDTHETWLETIGKRFPFCSNSH
jgi:glutathione synthase/RimK-type ligase-like ATP-grasp enzyme